MNLTESEARNKVKSDIIKHLEDATSRGFLVQMILATVFTYLATLATIVIIDLLLYQSTVGGIHFVGLIEYFLSSSLISFLPVAAVSTVFVVLMTRPIIGIMKRSEKGEIITEEQYFAARKRSANIPRIIFTINIIFPVIISLVSRVYSNGIGVGFVILIKDISIFILAAVAQNAVYQRILAKPRALMKVYTVDTASRNWFVKNIESIRLYASVIFMAAVLFHGAMTIIRDITPAPETPSAKMADQPDKENSAVNSLDKMRATMLQAGTAAGAAEQDDNSRIKYPVMFLILTLAILGIIRLVDLLASRAKNTQLGILKYVLTEMAEGSGDLTQRVLIVQADEVGVMSHQLNKLLDRLQKMFSNITEQTNMVAESSRAVSSVLEGTVAATEEMVASVAQINSNTSKNRQIVESSQESLNNMLESLDQINSNVNTQAAYIEQTSSAMTEMIANIQSVNEVTSKAGSLSEALKSVSDSGGQAVLNSIAAVRDIEESSNEVNNLVQIIARILAATNMLAMNAAIEAAHAGDAGRGFAVVAEEVRNLADDSSSNLKTISENIKNVIDRVNRGVNLSETAGDALNEVSEKTNQTTQLMNEVASAMQEQAAGANEVLNSINSLVEASGSINKQSEEQQKNNQSMKDNLEKTVNAFAEVQSATAELELGNREILGGIEELKEVILKNEGVVAALQKELGGFRI